MFRILSLTLLLLLAAPVEPQHGQPGPQPGGIGVAGGPGVSGGGGAAAPAYFISTTNIGGDQYVRSEGMSVKNVDIPAMSAVVYFWPRIDRFDANDYLLHMANGFRIDYFTDGGGTWHWAIHAGSALRVWDQGGDGIVPASEWNAILMTLTLSPATRDAYTYYPSVTGAWTNYGQTGSDSELDNGITDIRIGGDGGGENIFEGLISTVAFYDAVLTTGEVPTVPTACSGMPQANLLCCIDWSESATEPWTCTAGGASPWNDVSMVKENTVTPRGVVGVDEGTYIPNPLASAIGCWSFDNAGDLGNDDCTDTYDLTPVNAPGTTAGVSGTGATFVTASAQSFNLGAPLNGVRSISFWVYSTVASYDADFSGAIMSSNGFNDRAYDIFWTNTSGPGDALYFQFTQDADQNPSASVSYTTLPADQWVHIVAQNTPTGEGGDGKTRVYANGSLVGTSTGILESIKTTSTNFQIGNWAYGAATMSLDEVAVFPEALSTDDIAYLHDSFQ